ncbi:MAG: hypothetical protein IKL06_02705 [Lachnospiraceae bacterium]|nr:hypothetical protein [Lachnospiraceae bacterium]
MKIFADKHSNEMECLLKTLKTIDASCEVIVFEDNFFLPESFISAKEYVCFNPKQSKNNLYYAFLDLPDLWQVRPEHHLGAIYDFDTKKATIHFTDPIEKRIVKSIEWLSTDGFVYKTDYYNQYGCIQCTEAKNQLSDTIYKTFYSHDGTEVISYLPYNDTLFLYKNGRIQKIFDSNASFEQYIYSTVIATGETIILTTQRQVNDFTQIDTMQNANVYVILNDVLTLNNYQAEKQIPYPLFIMNNTHTSTSISPACNTAPRLCYAAGLNDMITLTSDALILTMSDQIEKISELVANLPEIHFHIAANTAVSDKLLSLKTYENVSIYPQISMEDLETLLEKCTFYFDINYGREIHNAVIQASMHNMIILGFIETLHNPHYILDECTFTCNNYPNLITKVHLLNNNSSFALLTLKKQHSFIANSLSILQSMLP